MSQLKLLLTFGSSVGLPFKQVVTFAHSGRYLLLFVLDFEERCDFIESFVLGFWHFFVGEHPEDCEENTERQEGIIL